MNAKSVRRIYSRAILEGVRLQLAFVDDEVIPTWASDEPDSMSRS